MNRSIKTESADAVFPKDPLIKFIETLTRNVSLSCRDREYSFTIVSNPVPPHTSTDNIPNDDTATVRVYVGHSIKVYMNYYFYLTKRPYRCDNK